MILIADSGSTKCDWVWGQSANDLNQCQTAGINPYIVDDTQISQILRSSPELSGICNDVQKVFFYGAGCSSDEKSLMVANTLQRFFTHAVVKVEHDLKGAALALCGVEPGIVCILGTGSNSCFFDGENILDRLPSLGFILGDEGAGVWIGKKIVTDLLYRKLPVDVENKLSETYVVDSVSILDRIYKQAKPNAFLATYAKFVIEHQDHAYCKKILSEGFNAFVDIHVQCYQDKREHPVHFIGSVALHCRELIEEILKDKGYRTGKFENKPIMSLARYHFDRNS